MLSPKTRLSLVAGPLLLLVVGFVASPAQGAPNAAADKGQWHTPTPPYPAEAHDRHLHGVGTLRFRTDAGGRVVEARMDPSTGSRVLDEASVQFVRTCWHGPPNRRHSTVLDYRFKKTVPAPGLGAYRNAVQKAVGQRWFASMNASYRERRAGVIRLGFVITPAGKVKDVRVLSGKGQPRLVSLSTAALLDANLPPMPAAVRAALPAGGTGNLDCTFNFELKP